MGGDLSLRPEPIKLDESIRNCFIVLVPVDYLNMIPKAVSNTENIQIRLHQTEIPFIVKETMKRQPRDFKEIRWYNYLVRASR